MAHISLERKHGVSHEEAVKKIDAFAEELMTREWPAGVKVVDPVKKWDGDTMRFSFRGKKGFLSAKMEGVLEITGDIAKIDMDVPGVVSSLIGEEKIKKVLSDRFDRLFAEA